MANKFRGTIYTGVTSNLIRRDYEHKHSVTGGFTKQYRCKLLVWFEIYDAMEQAILGEKQLKGGSRSKKIALVEAQNPLWQDLSASIQG